jgi:hypothetical protein
MLRLCRVLSADNPKFSCIVVVHKPSTVNNNIMVQMLPGRF